MITGQAMLEPPAEGAHELKRMLWNASGPGRAWNLRERARAIKRSARDWQVAQDIIARVDAIFDLYRRGAHDWATLELERLDAEVQGALRERNTRSAAAGSGGNRGAQQKKRSAEAWQEKITAEARRLLRGKHSCEAIGARLSPKTALDGKPPVAPGTVAKFVRTLGKK
jgi:hypothetical protein